MRFAAPIDGRRAAALTLGAALAVAPVAAGAQAYQCRVPGRVAVPRIVPDGPARRAPVTGYLLALSWSPEYCRGRERRPADARQCGGREGRFGLIVHGLWPQGARAAPQWCPAPRAPSAAELAPNLCQTPSARLLAREWAKHGACMTRTPGTYFRVSRILFEGLRIPDLDRLSREQGLTAGFLRARMAEANGGWRPQAIGLVLNERGWLREMRLCYDARFRPRACDRLTYGAPDGQRVKIWRGL